MVFEENFEIESRKIEFGVPISYHYGEIDPETLALDDKDKNTVLLNFKLKEKENILPF